MQGDFAAQFLVGGAIVAILLLLGYVVHLARKRRSPEYRAQQDSYKRARWQEIESRRAAHEARKAARADRFAPQD